MLHPKSHLRIFQAKIKEVRDAYLKKLVRAPLENEMKLKKLQEFSEETGIDVSKLNVKHKIGFYDRVLYYKKLRQCRLNQREKREMEIARKLLNEYKKGQKKQVVKVEYVPRERTIKDMEVEGHQMTLVNKQIRRTKVHPIILVRAHSRTGRVTKRRN